MKRSLDDEIDCMINEATDYMRKRLETSVFQAEPLFNRLPKPPSPKRTFFSNLRLWIWYTWYDMRHRLARRIYPEGGYDDDDW